MKVLRVLSITVKSVKDIQQTVEFQIRRVGGIIPNQIIIDVKPRAKRVSRKG